MPKLNLDKLSTVAFIIAAFALLTIASMAFYTIDGTERGVLMNWGNPQMEPLMPGWGMKIPYQQEIVRYNIQTQRYDAVESAASKDLQDVSTGVAVNYRLDPDRVPEIHVNLGQNYAQKIIEPAVKETVKQITAEFTANDLIQKRALVKDGTEDGIRKRLQPYGILIDEGGVSLTEFKYSEEFSNAVEAKVTAVQLKDKAQNDLERIKIERDQKIAQAEADIKYATPDMLALKQIEVNKLYIEKWNGVLPAFVSAGDSGTLMMLGMNDIQKV